MTYVILLQLKKWSLVECGSVTYSGIMVIIEHCKELCYLELVLMNGLTPNDMNAIYVHLLETGKKVDTLASNNGTYYTFKIT
jgi:hypothetical protein